MRGVIDMPYGMPRGEGAPDRAGELTLAAAALAFASGVVHLALIVPHLRESVVLAVLFSLAGVAEIGWGVAALRLRTPMIVRSGQALLLSIAVGWLMSRTIGLPFGIGAPEPVGLLDCLTTGCELFAIYALSWLAAPRRSAAVAYAGLTLAVLLLLSLATLGHHAVT
jgi:hypothetical protein